MRRTLVGAMVSTMLCVAAWGQQTQNPGTSPLAKHGPPSNQPADTTCKAPQGTPVLPLRTNSRFIVDSSGKRFKLSGAGWYGAESTDFVVNGLQLEPLSAIVRHVRCMGLNSVRMLWSNEMYESNPVVPNYAVTANPQLKGMRALQVFDVVVRELARQGILVILDNHNSNAEWCCGADGNELWYNAKYPEASWIADWKGMVARYKDVPQVVGADLRNEPRISASWGGDPSTDWHAAAQRGGNAVLSVNPKLLIIVEGVGYALDLTGAASLPVQLNVKNRLVYSAHDYPFDHNGVQSYDSLAQTLTQNWGYLVTPGMPYTAPVWVGEFGNCHNQTICLVDNNANDGSGGFWFQSFRKYLDQTDIDWSYWPLNGTESTGSGRIYGGEDSYGLLNPYWNAPSMPSELSPLPSVNTLSLLQPLIAPNQGTVASTGYPPVVTMVSPLPGSTVISGSSVSLNANAALRSGSSDAISAVQYYASGAPVATSSSAPYVGVWQNVPPGTFQVSAKVLTHSGLSNESEPIPLQAVNYMADAPQYKSSIAINFVSYAVMPMAPSEIAGVVPVANWNQASGATNSGELMSLVDQSGSATTASVIWNSPNSYFTAIADQPGNNRMMKGYLDNNNVQPNTVQINGLPANFKTYDVIAYFDGGNEGASSPARAANYRLTTLIGDQIRGCGGLTTEGSTVSGLDASNVDFSGSFILAANGSPGNYVKFVNCTGSSFTLAPVHGGSTDTQYRAPLNGLQILARSK